MKEQTKRKSRMGSLLTALKLAVLGLILLVGTAGAVSHKQEGALDRALTHPSAIVRYGASRDFIFWKTGSKPHMLEDEHEAWIERERRLRLEELIYLLEIGKLDQVTKTGRWLVAGTLEDSWDHENLMRAAKAIRLFGREEKKKNILASSEDSVFRTIFEGGLISWCYPGSWSSKVSSVAFTKEKDKTGKSYKRRKKQIEALSKALRVFGPEAAEVVVNRLEEAVCRIHERGPYECHQIVTVLEFLNGHTVSVVDRLIHILEPEYEKRKFRGNFWVERAIVEAIPYDPERVNTTFSNSSITERSSEYRYIKNKLAEHIGVQPDP